MRACHTATVVLATAVAALPQARADTDGGEVVVLDPLTITSERDRSAVPTRSPTVDSDPHPLGATDPPTLAGWLRGLPGMLIQEGFGGIDPPRLSVRGSGLQSAPVSRGVMWTLDGLPLNAVDGSFNTALIEPALIDAIELARGASDSAAATSALGGALHLRWRDQRPARVWISGGPDRHRRAGMHAPLVGDGATGGRRAWGGVAYTAWDGWRPQSAQQRLAGAAEIVARPDGRGPTARLSLYAVQPRFNVPGPLTLDAARRLPRSISTLAATDRPRRETDFARIALDLRWTQEAGARDDATRLALAAQHTDDWFRQLRANGITATRGGDLTALLETRRRVGTHTLRGGLLARTGHHTQQRWHNVGGEAGTRFAAPGLDATHTVIWCDDSWVLARALALDTGLTFARATRTATGAIDGAHGRFAHRGLAPRLGVAWQPREALRWHARASRGFEPPTFDDLLATRGAPGALMAGWSPLRVQYADTLELGASGRSGVIAWSCTAYTSRWTGELLRLADTDGSPLGAVNTPRTLHRGVETALRWRLRRDEGRVLDLALTHTWSQATFTGDAARDGLRLAGLPPHAGRADLTWSAAHGWFASAGASWIAGTTWADHANRLGYGGHVLADLRLGWADRRGWSVSLAMDNLFDRATVASTSGVIDIARQPATTALFLPGLPRQVRVGLTWTR